MRFPYTTSHPQRTLQLTLIAVICSNGRTYKTRHDVGFALAQKLCAGDKGDIIKVIGDDTTGGEYTLDLTPSLHEIIKQAAAGDPTEAMTLREAAM